MPSAPLGFCATPHCTQRVRAGHCDIHKKDRGEQKRFSQDSRYGSQRWRLYSQRRLAEHPYCVQCGKLAEVTDHRLPVRTHPELFWDEDNHDSLCQDCNRGKG